MSHRLRQPGVGLIQDGQEQPPGQDLEGDRARRPGSTPITRILHVDAKGRVVRDPEESRTSDQNPSDEPMSLADLLPESASVDIVSAIRAAADTGNAQFLEFDLLSKNGVRRIHAEAMPDPERQGEFVITAREYSSPETLDRANAVERFAASAAETSDVDAVFQELAGVLAGLLTYDRLVIVTVDHERDEQLVIFSTDADQEAVIPLTGTAIEVVSRTDEPLVVPAAIPSVIVVPLHSAGETIAYIGVHSKAWESYGDYDLATVAGFGPPVAAALATDRHRERLSRASGENDALRSISAVAAAAGDLFTMLEVAADRIHRQDRFSLVRVEATATIALANSGPEAVATRGVDPQLQSDGPCDWAGDHVWTIGASAEPLGAISIRPSGAGDLDEADHRFLSECALRLAQGIERIRSGREIDRLKVELDCSREMDRVTAGLSDLDAMIAMAEGEITRLARPQSLVIRVNYHDSEQVRVERRRGAAARDGFAPGSPEEPGGRSATIPLLGPDGAIGSISAFWSSDEDARTGVLRLEAMTPRLAERVHALLVLESSESSSRDARCLAEIEAAIERCAEPGLALDEATSVLCDRFEGARVAVALLDESGATLSELSVNGFPIAAWAGGGNRAARGGLEQAALLSAGPISSSSATPDALVARWPAEAAAVGAGIRSLAAVALPTGGGISACLSARSPKSHEGGGFTEGDNDLLRRAATLIAGPVLRLSADVTTTGSDSEWAALARFGQISQSAPDADIPYARLIAELASMVKFDQVEIATLAPGGETAHRVYLSGTPVPGWEQGSEFRLPGTVTEAVVRSRTGLFVGGESPAELAGRFPAQAAALAAELRSFIAVPLVIDEEPAGSLVIRSTEPAAYSQRELSIVEAAAVHLSAAIARGRLRKQIKRQRREGEAIASIGSSWELEPEVIAERAAAAYRRLVDCDGLVVTAVSPDADTVRVVSALGVDEAEKRFFGGRLDRLETGPSDVDRDGYASSLRARIGPISRPLGYMHVFASRHDAFTADDSDLLQRVAQQLGSAFERARAADHSSRLSAEQGLRRRLDQQNRELRELTVSRDRFLRTVVHELRTPLMSVQLITDLLMQNAPANLGEEQMAQLGLIADSGERLQGLVSNLLDVSQIESETFELVHEEFDAGLMIRELCESFGVLLAARAQRIELSRPDEPLWLLADQPRLSSALSNLISNACKYSDDGMVVRIKVDREGSQLRVAVADDGIGISTEDLDKLFAPFSRGTNPIALRQPGTGLGLVIARTIARLHGGDLTLESAPGHGTTARFHVEGVLDGPSEAYLARVAAQNQSGMAG